MLVLNFSKAQQGANIYKQYCSGCHGKNLEGASAPKLSGKNWVRSDSIYATLNTIRNGVARKDMPAFKKTLTGAQISSLVSFLKSFQKTTVSQDKSLPTVLKTKYYRLKVEKLVTSNLSDPWGIEFINKNRALITERKTGNLRWLINGKLDPKPITGLPRVFTSSTTSGLLDVALDPGYALNGWIYVAFSHTTDSIADKESPLMTKIIRGKVKDHKWTEEQTLFEVADSLYVRNGDRWGGRLFFDKKGLLYFSIGDMARAMDSQDSTKPTGKIFRINTNSSIPADNPYVSSGNALPAIYSMGNRNVQGFAQDPATGKIWISEHGPKGGDELNILKKGANYGWPVITYGVDYDGTIISKKDHQDGMLQPITQWTPSIAVCPIEFCTGPLFPKWKGNLLVGALAYEELRRLTIVDDKVVAEEKIFKGYGRVRDVKIGPEGAIYVLLNNPDMLIRIRPE